MFDVKLSCKPQAIGGCYLKNSKPEDKLNFWKTTLEACKNMGAKVYKGDLTRTTELEFSIGIEKINSALKGELSASEAAEYAYSITHVLGADKAEIEKIRLTVLDKHLN